MENHQTELDDEDGMFSPPGSTLCGDESSPASSLASTDDYQMLRSPQLSSTKLATVTSLSLGGSPLTFEISPYHLPAADACRAQT